MGIREWRDRRGQMKLQLSKKLPDGTRFRRVMPNKTIAKKLEAKIDYAVAMGTWPELRKELFRTASQTNENGSNLTISGLASEYFAYCQRRNRRPDFKKQALVSIKRILGPVEVQLFRRRDADRFVDRRLAEGASPATVNRNLAVLKNMFSIAVDREYVDSHPLLRYRMLPEVQKALRILTYDEYRKLISCVAESDPVIGAYVVVLGETGMRKSEGLRLKWEHVRMKECIVVIDNTKSGKVRSVPLSELALEWLGKLIRFVNVPEVFVNASTGKPWKDPREAYCKGRTQAGLEWVRLHDLRHFRATQWLANGVDINTVKELLGHASIQTTMRYLHYVPTRASESVIQAQKRETTEWQQSHLEVEDKWKTTEV